MRRRNFLAGIASFPATQQIKPISPSRKTLCDELKAIADRERKNGRHGSSALIGLTAYIIGNEWETAASSALDNWIHRRIQEHPND